MGNKARKGIRWIIAAAALIILAAASMTACVDMGLSATQSINGVVYDTSGETATVVRCRNGKRGECNILPSVGGKSVTGIGDDAFYYCDKLTGITIPDSVTTIGSGAFYDCRSLTGITIPDSVISIGDNAFQSCISLSDITIPDSVTTIGAHAFRWCDSLTEITVPSGVTSIGDGAFYDCSELQAIFVSDGNKCYYSKDGVLFSIDNQLISYPRAKIDEKYLIPDVVTGIGDYAFYWCRNLKYTAIPDSVTTIGAYAFKWCDNLTDIAVPDGVNTIGEGAFAGCNKLTEIIIPESVTAIGSSAFKGCKELKAVNVDDGNKCYYSEDGVLFDTDNQLIAYPAGKTDSQYVVPDSVTGIGDEAFFACGSLNGITIPDGVISIGESAFEGCGTLTSVIIPDSVTDIGKNAFYSYYGAITINAPHDPSYYNYTPTKNETWITE